MLLPRVADTPLAAPPAGSTSAGSPTPIPAAADRSPVMAPASAALVLDGAAGPANAGGSPAGGFSAELALAGIFPFDATTAAAVAPPVPQPQGPAPAGAVVADYGHGPGTHWPLEAGLAVSLLVLGGGALFLWWRNRESRYFPA